MDTTEKLFDAIVEEVISKGNYNGFIEDSIFRLVINLDEEQKREILKMLTSELGKNKIDSLSLEELQRIF